MLPFKPEVTRILSQPHLRQLWDVRVAPHEYVRDGLVVAQRWQELAEDPHGFTDMLYQVNAVSHWRT